MRRPVRTPAIWSSRSSRSALVLALLLALAPSPAQAQDGGDLPAATATPGDPDAPNGGQWFAVTAEPGETLTLTAQVQNPADVAQQVSLYLTDLGFDDDRPVVGDVGVGVGGWGEFEEPRLDLAPHALTPARFTITVPDDAEPGDHIGAVVVESQPTAGGAVQVVKRVATRLYVTVPGDARAAIEIESVDVDLDGVLLPRRAHVTTVVRNTGTTGLDATVTVNGHRLEGATRIVTRSGERYEGDVPVSVLGGRVSFHVVADTSGPTAETTESVVVVPWWTVIALFLAGLGFLTVRELSRRLR